MSILAILLGLIALTFLPTFILGWLFAGWRPWLMSLLILGAFIWIHPNVNLHPVASLIHYFVVVALYVGGGKVRTGKSEDELLSGKPQEET